MGLGRISIAMVISQSCTVAGLHWARNVGFAHEGDSAVEHVCAKDGMAGCLRGVRLYRHDSNDEKSTFDVVVAKQCKFCSANVSVSFPVQFSSFQFKTVQFKMVQARGGRWKVEWDATPVRFHSPGIICFSECPVLLCALKCGHRIDRRHYCRLALLSSSAKE